jgi:predicted DNA-binding protein
MKTRRRVGEKREAESAAAVRASISFPPDVYETLESIAKEKKVSLAWVVREAAENYIAQRWPLFQPRK